MVERRQLCKKYFFRFFFRKPEPRAYFFCLRKTAHFLIKRCTFSARGKFFGPGLRGKIFRGAKFCKRWKACKKYFLVFFYENPNPGTTFFVYWKLLISLLNGAFFRLGENFSVRGNGARFLAAFLHQLSKRMVGTPTARCAQPVWGKKSKTWSFQGKPKNIQKTIENTRRSPVFSENKCFLNIFDFVAYLEKFKFLTFEFFLIFLKQIQSRQ